jgi:beta-glucosidase
MSFCKANGFLAVSHHPAINLMQLTTSDNRLLRVIIILCVYSCVTLANGPGHRSSATERKIDSLLSILTLEEKVGQLVQVSGNFNDGSGRKTLTPEHIEMIRQGRVGSFLNVFGAAASREVQRIAIEESRLKIPLLFGFDVIHGYLTTFPIPLAEASTWDPAFIEKAERVAAVEATAAGIHWTFAPMVDIARDPRWGRIAEGAGEDPYLGSCMAAARVRGFQGEDLAAESSLMACAKHFAGYGGAEGGRDYNTVDISERTLREVYLPPFKAAVDAGVGTLMSSFNEISGIPSTANVKLITNTLRGEWGFEGFVVSDWNSVGELINHGVAADPAEAAVLGLKAGVDMDMESYCYQETLATAVRDGRVSESELNEAVRRILQAKFRLGLFDNPYKNCNANREHKDILTAEHRRMAREVAQRSIVLLKNEGPVLPLRKDLKSVAVIGPLADDTATPLGPWKQNGRPEDVVSVLSGIKSKLSAGTLVVYAKGCEVEGSSKNGIAEAVETAGRADAVIAVVGESASMSGEGASRSSLNLPGDQEGLVKAMLAIGKPLVVVLMNGRPLAIPWIAANVPAIIETWFLGVECGNAVADVLFGDVNPSGKLPVTFPRAVGQLPVYYNHKNTGRPADDHQRNTSRYIDLPSTPLYPFGYGLSYTSFSYSQLQLGSTIMKPGDSVVVSVVVKNTGNCQGEEVVQLYIRDEVGSVTRPVKELKAFLRISLTPGQSRQVCFTLTPEQLKFYDRSMRWSVEPGKFKVYVGPNSAQGLDGEFTYTSS